MTGQKTNRRIYFCQALLLKTACCWCWVYWNQMCPTRTFSGKEGTSILFLFHSSPWIVYKLKFLWFCEIFCSYIQRMTPFFELEATLNSGELAMFFYWILVHALGFYIILWFFLEWDYEKNLSLWTIYSFRKWNWLVDTKDGKYQFHAKGRMFQMFSRLRRTC